MTTPANNSGSAFGDTYISIENLRGTNFDDVLKGDAGNNVLTGSLGADRFVYSGGADTVTDFSDGQGDRIDLSALDIHSFAQLNISGTSNALIDLGSGNTITLNGVTPGSLVADDFVFTPRPFLSVTINGGVTASGGRPVNGAQPFSQFLGFGDSNIDSGYFLTHTISNDPAKQSLYDDSAAIGGGIPTTPGAQMNSQLLAGDFGLTAIPVGMAGGTNYAASGATVIAADDLSGSLAPDVATQIQTYLSSVGGVADPNALYLISGGGNDAKNAAALDAVAGTNYMINAAHGLATALEQLHAAGARYIVIDDRTGNGAFSTPFNDTLWSDLTAAGVPFIAADDAALQRAIVANPAAYGISNAVQPPGGPFNTTSHVYDPANGGQLVNPSPSTISKGWALYATDFAPGAAANYLWADNEHFAAAGQQLEANYVSSLVGNAHPTVGQTLTATPNLISDGDNSLSQVTYQWQELPSGQSTWNNISGATSSSYIVQSTDLNAQLRVEATLVDPDGPTVVVDSPATYSVMAKVSSNDFNGDGTSDILWRNDNGALVDWQMNAGSIANNFSVGSISSDWQFQGTGDFDADGKSDILWRNSTGTVALWEMNGGSIASATTVATVSSDWNILGIGEFSGDTNADILWRNNNGQLSLWQMNGGTILSASSIGTISSDWALQSTGDFNGDGNSDLLWRNSTGTVSLWEMNNGSIANSATVATVATDWQIIGTGDFNADGNADILWRNSTSNAVVLWEMNGSTIANSLSVGTISSDWSVQSTADANADGTADILWRNSGGSVALWEMNGASITSSLSVATVDNTWSIQKSATAS